MSIGQVEMDKKWDDKGNAGQGHAWLETTIKILSWIRAVQTGDCGIAKDLKILADPDGSDLPTFESCARLFIACKISPIQQEDPV